MSTQDAKKDRSEIWKNYAQIVAIAIAGIWTIYLFVITNRPGLENRGTVSNSLVWYRLGDTDKRLIEFYVGIENKGTTSFDISKINLRVWEFTLDTEKPGLTYVDPEVIRKAPPFFDRAYELNQTQFSPFPAHYPPGASTGNTFDWLITPDCKKWLFFAAEVYKKGDKQVTWSTYTWWQECPHPEDSGSQHDATKPTEASDLRTSPPILGVKPQTP